MKTSVIKSSILAGLVFIGLSLSAQTPPPPNGNGGNPTQGDNTPVGGGAPIGGGVALLIALGLGYGAKKVYDYKKHKLAE
jgi:hypothetical protein